MCSKHDNHSRLNSEHKVFWGPIRPVDEHQELYVGNELDIHTSSKNYEESDLELDLLTTAYNSCVSYFRRRGLVGRLVTTEGPCTLHEIWQ